jgi:hypothetical protein
LLIREVDGVCRNSCENKLAPILKNQRAFQWALIFLVFWFILLCAIHLFYKRPLWNDEECVFMSIQSFTPQQFFSDSLQSLQVFPRLYLFLIQKIAKPFDHNLFILRLPSFVCMIAAFFLWLRLARYELKDNLLYLIFVGSWIASGSLLYYSAELKQYSMDVLAGALSLLFLYHQQQWEQCQTGRWRYGLVLAFLPSLGLFSYPTFLFALLPLWNLILSSRKNLIFVRYLCLYTVALGFFMSISYFSDMRLRPTEVLDKGFGDYMISFASVGEFFKTWGEGTNNLFSRWFVEFPRYFRSIARLFVTFGFIYMFYGFFNSIKKDRFFLKSIDTISFILFVQLFILGALRLYPFTVPRTSLFFCPVVLYLTIKGIGFLQDRHKHAYWIFMGLYIIFLVFLMVAQSRMAFIGKLSFSPSIF